MSFILNNVQVIYIFQNNLHWKISFDFLSNKVLSTFPNLKNDEKKCLSAVTWKCNNATKNCMVPIPTSMKSKDDVYS